MGPEQSVWPFAWDAIAQTLTPDVKGYAISFLDPTMKTLIVMPSASCHGGAEAALLHLLQQRDAAGLELRLIFLESGEMVALARELGVEAEVIPAGRLRSLRSVFGTVRAIRAVIHSWKPSIVLGWMTKAHIYSGLAARGTGTAAMYFQMGIPDGGVVDRLARLVPASGALGCSEFIAREQGAKVRHPVKGVALAADVSRSAAQLSTPELKQKLEFDPARPLVGIVGRLQHWKGMHVYLRAMSLVTQTFPEVQGVIVGGVHDQEPGYLQMLEQIRAELGLNDVVRMVGKQSNVPDWMGAMDVVVHASQREPFGIVVVEAMALGKAVVATEPGGPEEIVNDGLDGLLAPWNEPDALAKAILHLLQNPAAAVEMGANALKRSTHFTTRTYAIRTAEALRTLLSSASVKS
jgi:glycosyltransferase involved in cell wall biosynthesis